ncbi:MAG: RNA pseudouridine synthase [Treponema sp.]|jgi:23S rRNA pseudouridine1911/1915/1917 synthase|nr:RNA pseudouridine synthase [Treponema sp.]
MVLFQNEACLVINKSAGESSESSDSNLPDKEGKVFAMPVHRLDMPVTGCLLLAKTPESAAFLSAAFARRDRKIKKLYWAVIEMPDCALQPEGKLTHWIGFERRSNKSVVHAHENAHNKQGKNLQKAVLRYQVIGKGERYLFLEIELITGRHHQIRAQLAALSLHIKGDLKYGAKRSEKGGGIRLHAFSLSFPNPLKPDETIEVKTLPPRMDPLWKAFAEAAGFASPS